MNRDTKIGGLRQAADAGNRIFSFHSVFQARLLAVVAAALIAATPAHGNPKGGQVSVGSAAISQTSPTRRDVVQSPDRAAIDWQASASRPTSRQTSSSPRRPR